MPMESVQGSAPELPAAGVMTNPAPNAGCTCQPSGKLLDVRRSNHERLSLTERLGWLESSLSEIVRGGVYLNRTAEHRK